MRAATANHEPIDQSGEMLIPRGAGVFIAMSRQLLAESFFPVLPAVLFTATAFGHRRRLRGLLLCAIMARAQGPRAGRAPDCRAPAVVRQARPGAVPCAVQEIRAYLQVSPCAVDAVSSSYSQCVFPLIWFGPVWIQ